MDDHDAVKLQPMVHVTDMAASVSFYEALGATVVQESADGDFVVLRIGRGELSLLAHPANPLQGEGDVELNFEAADLDALFGRLRSAGLEAIDPPTDEGFGRQLQVRAPGGMLIKVNQVDLTLFGEQLPAPGKP